ncbi:NUDIX hydrolase domain-like protein [Gigaspora margarita]|uniref:NUDIX hydrolase domain-like protein n=1 Tax=Gigaspora margarita TaxID=4874 RepID=A0A8H4EH79_GIGMA|nr:NUDIX hydrolase domain-like protein [Gigaspora margarita]
MPNFKNASMNTYIPISQFFKTQYGVRFFNASNKTTVYPTISTSMRPMQNFDEKTIELIRARLKNSLGKSNIKFKYNTNKVVKDAAVLLPFCVVQGEPSVLFTIRSKYLKTHNGEVSFPGGKKEITDPSLSFTALRETNEEIGIRPEDIDILGQSTPLPNKDQTLKVYPFIGFIKTPFENIIDEIHFNKDEVQGVFTVTIEELLYSEKKQWKRLGNTNLTYPVFQASSMVGIEIWGLTAFILDTILRRLTVPPLTTEIKTFMSGQ